MTQHTSQFSSDLEWKSLHKVTPFSRIGALWVALALVAYNIVLDVLRNKDLSLKQVIHDINPSYVAIFFAILLGISLLVSIYGIVSWKKMAYAIHTSGIHIKRGIFIKYHGHMRWDRVQSVEIQQKFFSRIFGFGSVRVESGSHQDATEIGLLRISDCAQLRREILLGLANVRAGRPYNIGEYDLHTQPAAHQTASYGTQLDSCAPHMMPTQTVAHSVPNANTSVMGSTGTSGGYVASSGGSTPLFNPAAIENDILIYKVPTWRLLASHLLQVPQIIAISLTAISIAITWFLANEPAIIFIFFTVLIPVIYSIVRMISYDYGQKIYLSENGIRIRSGLFTLRTVSLPPQRIHAVQLNQRWLWRKFDWWTMQVTVAGTDDVVNMTDTSTILAAGSRADAMRVLWTLLPSIGTSSDQSILDEAFDGRCTGKYFLGAPPSARWVDPWIWQRNGICLTPNVAIFRRGRFTKKISILWQDHTQSLRISQGPIQAKLGLASLSCDLVPGVVECQAKNFPVDQIQQLIWIENHLTAKARERGVSETITEWINRVGLRENQQDMTR